jgi:CRISPR/Cas system-associated protein Cas7 (RAMP superfamily)
MNNNTLITEIMNDIHYSHSKSGWHWWQNVNKRETKARGKLPIDNNQHLNEEQKKMLYQALWSHITKEWVLQLYNQEERSLHVNQQKLKHHFQQLLVDILINHNISNINKEKSHKSTKKKHKKH